MYFIIRNLKHLTTELYPITKISVLLLFTKRFYRPCEDDELNESDRLSVNEKIKDVQEVNVQLKAQLTVANDETARLKQLLSDVKMEITKLQKEVKCFGIEVCHLDKDILYWLTSCQNTLVHGI